MAELVAEVSFTEKKHAAILNAEKIRQKEELAKLKARTQILDEIKKNDCPVDAKMGVDKDNMKHLIKKGDLKNFLLFQGRNRRSQLCQVQSLKLMVGKLHSRQRKQRSTVRNSTQMHHHFLHQLVSPKGKIYLGYWRI